MFPFKRKKEKASGEKVSIVEKVVNLGVQIYEGYSFESTIYNRIVTTIKVFIVATRKFMLDDCLTKASAIAYTTIVSLIPTLTVLITFMSIFKGMENKKEDLFRDISLFMIEHSIKLNLDFIFEAISGLIDNAKAIGIIGTLFVFFTATATLRALEKSLNDIWRVKQGRTLFQRIIYYWAALTLGPVMLVSGTTVATKLSNIFASANYNSISIYGDRLWVVGSKGSIITTDINDKNLNQLPDEIIVDYENQKIYSYTTKDGFSDVDFRLDSISLFKEDFRDIQFIEKEGWIVGTKGIILYTSDSGKTWSISKWGDFTFNDIHMINNKRGFISTDRGVVFSTDDGGYSWSLFDTKDISINFTSIRFRDNTGIVTANRGRILFTSDYGNTWTLRTINEAKRKKRLVDLNDVCFVNSKSIWIAGNDGVLLHSGDSGNTWNYTKFKEFNYYAVLFFNSYEGIVTGEKGVIIHTDNGGNSWKSGSLPAHKINRLFYDSGNVWAIGDRGVIQKSADKGIKWSGRSGKSIFAMLINFLAPFFFIWLMFLLAYTTIPNTKIPFKFASIGASFTGAIWVIFILLFIVYIKSFASGTFAIYGALASIPLFLIMIYASALIILFGAEVSFTVMHPETYTNLKSVFEDTKKVNLYYAFVVLQTIYFKFEAGHGSTQYSELMKKTSNSSVDVDYFLNLFIENKMIMNDSEGDYTPTNSSENIKLSSIFDLINEAKISVPSSGRKHTGPGSLKDIMERLKSQRNITLDDISLKDLVI